MREKKIEALKYLQKELSSNKELRDKLASNTLETLKEAGIPLEEFDFEDFDFPKLPDFPTDMPDGKVLFVPKLIIMDFKPELPDSNL